jgi:hypothetical protein
MGLSVPDAAILVAGLRSVAFTIVGIVATKFPQLPGRSLSLNLANGAKKELET